MVLRLDPRYPVAWRSPTSMQLGFTHAPLILDDVSPATERMIAALVAGISDTGLDMIGRSAGASAEEVAVFLERVRPALVVDVPERRHRVTVVGAGTTAEAVAGLLAAAGIDVIATRSAGRAADTEADLVVIVAGYAVRPELAATWLRRDVPHLAVVLGDDTADVGPLVVPGGSACLLCLAHHATDADTAWPVLATQLHGRPSPADTALLAAEVAVTVVRLVRDHLGGVSPATGEVVRIDAMNGTRTARGVAPHPLCGCLAMPLASAATRSVPRASASAATR